MEELNGMWGFAEDLESYEYVCKELLNWYGGPVRISLAGKYCSD
jgi:hypothetical protein